MAVYYNEWDSFAADWLRELMADGLIPEGEIDERSICDVRADDLRGFKQCHFFAGIGGWPLALEFAGWGEKQVWTGSCPCQPLSSAGQRKGHADERHLWPAFFDLIAELRPATVLGEQVASKDGREWFAGVRADLEAVGYACGAADLCAAGVGAPHIRQRLWWVASQGLADSDSARCEEQNVLQQRRFGTSGSSPNGRLADSEGAGRCRSRPMAQQRRNLESGGSGADGRLADSNSRGQSSQRRDHAEMRGVQEADCKPEHSSAISGRGCSNGRLGNADQPGPQGHGEPGERAGQFPAWAPSILIPCADGKQRRVPADEHREIEPALFPLAYDGTIRNRVGTLRGAGNAISPQIAAEFIAAYMETKGT